MLGKFIAGDFIAIASEMHRIPALNENTAIFQSYHGSQFYWWRKPEYPERTTDISQVTDKLYHIITPRHERGSNSHH
jgi:hypothetical protein